MAKAGSRKKLPKEVAVINADNCTGCEACLQVCPVDCISKVAGESISVLQSWCEIDVELVPTILVAQAVASKGGPPEYLEQNWDRLVVPAQRMAELAASS